MVKKKSLLFMALLSLTIIIIGACSSKDDSPLNMTMEIHRVSFVDGKYSFDKENMSVEKSWTFTDEKDIKLLAGIFGNLDPKGGRPTSDVYNTYLLRKTYQDNQSVEQWILWIDRDFSKSGAAENETDKGWYKALDVKNIKQLEKLLK